MTSFIGFNGRLSDELIVLRLETTHIVLEFTYVEGIRHPLRHDIVKTM